MAKVRDYLTVDESAEYLGVHPDRLRRWDRAGKLEPHRHPVNKLRLYLKRGLGRFLAQMSGNGSTRNRASRPNKRQRLKRKR